MKTTLFAQGRKLVLVSLLAFALGLAGCSDGDDGAPGAPGADGAPGTPGSQVVNVNAETFDALNAEITGVTIASPPVVAFTVTDAAGRGVVGLQAANTGVRFALAKLVPGTNGDPDSWVNYVRNSAGNPTYNRVAENLVDHGDGSYSYTFSVDVATATDGDGVVIGYDPTLTHRAAVQISGGDLPAVNVVYDFVPNGSAVTTMRDIVMTDSCNECHGAIVFHGSRYEVKYCVVCHNPDFDGGEGDLTFMVHRIHSGGTFAVFDDAASFAEMTYPQDLENCRKCHNGDDAATPQGNNWKMKPSMSACGGCHSSVVFASGDGHEGGPQANNSACAGCHTEAGIETVHTTVNATPNNPAVPEGVSNFEYQIIDVTVNGSNKPVVHFKILRDGVALDLNTGGLLPSDLTGSPGFLLGWADTQDGIATPIDYNNLGRSSGQPISVNLYHASDPNLLAGTAGTVTTSGGISTATFNDEFPVGTGMRVVAIQSYFSQTVGAASVSRHTPAVVKEVTGDVARRLVVDNAKCANCHEWLELHGGSRTYNTQVCVICHNPNLSSSGREIVTPNARVADVLGAVALLYPEATNNFKDMIHGIHAKAIRTTDYEFVRNRNDGYYYNWTSGGPENHPVLFPNDVGNCKVCHLDGTYAVPLADDLLMTTNRTTGVVDGLDATNAAVGAAQDSVPNDTDWVITPATAACYACHDSVLAVAHMEQNGGAVNRNRIGVAANEACAVCHASGRYADVEVVHGMD